MSIGDWENESFQNPPKGNFQPPITSYELAEFGELLGYSGAKMATLMTDTIEHIKSHLAKTVELTEAQNLDCNEREYIKLCVSLINQECDYLLQQVDSVPDMAELL